MSENSRNEIPSHIGFIMDGNRRWAKKNGLSTLEGYQAGADALERVLKACIERGVKFVTVYAFSTENWRRPEDEKSVLMTLFKKGIGLRLGDLVKLGIKVNFVGRMLDFPEDVQKSFTDVAEKTKNNHKLTLNVAVSYGGRAEIVDAVKKIMEKGTKPEEVTEDLISENIYEAGQPDPELIVRGSGESRLSGFLLWQSSYSELYFTNTLWPDFNEVELDKALDYYINVKRNFGK